MYMAGMPEAKMEVFLSSQSLRWRDESFGGGVSGWQMRMLHECFRGKQRAELSSLTLGLLKMELGNMRCIEIAGEKAMFYSSTTLSWQMRSGGMFKRETVIHGKRKKSVGSGSFQQCQTKHSRKYTNYKLIFIERTNQCWQNNVNHSLNVLSQYSSSSSWLLWIAPMWHRLSTRGRNWANSNVYIRIKTTPQCILGWHPFNGSHGSFRNPFKRGERPLISLICSEPVNSHHLSTIYPSSWGNGLSEWMFRGCTELR